MSGTKSPGVMSAFPVTRIGENFTYDFSSDESQVYGGIFGHKEIATGIWGMTAADANADGSIDLIDKTNSWMPEAGLSGYYIGDLNMDYDVNNLDKNDMWFINDGENYQVPE
ncbi:MAG: hypothetical protein R2750_13200 [Bacteroidales bacterium]